MYVLYRRLQSHLSINVPFCIVGEAASASSVASSSFDKVDSSLLDISASSFNSILHEQISRYSYIQQHSYNASLGIRTTVPKIHTSHQSLMQQVCTNKNNVNNSNRT